MFTGESLTDWQGTQRIDHFRLTIDELSEGSDDGEGENFAKSKMVPAFGDLGTMAGTAMGHIGGTPMPRRGVTNWLGDAFNGHAGGDSGLEFLWA